MAEIGNPGISDSGEARVLAGRRAVDDTTIRADEWRSELVKSGGKRRVSYHQHTYYERGRNVGRCGRCSGKSSVGRDVCERCWNYVKEAHRNRYVQQVISGVCVTCRRVSLPGKRYCLIHHRRYNEMRTARRVANKIANRCSECGRAAMAGNTLCLSHKTARNARNTEDRKKQKLVSDKERRSRRYEMGLCVCCGGTPRMGFKMCRRCAKYSRDNLRRNRAKRKADREAQRS